MKGIIMKTKVVKSIQNPIIRSRKSETKAICQRYMKEKETGTKNR